MNDILSQIIAYSPNKIDTETKARAMVQGPRNMKLAEVPRSEMDNFNTPDLEQSPDSFLRPGETLEDFDVEFRRPNADGGRIPFEKAGEVKKLNKSFLRHGTFSDDPARLKKINDYVKEFKKDYGVKPTAKNIRETLKEQRRVIPFYEKKYGELPKGKTNKITNVQKDVVKILKDPKIIAKLEAGKFPTITDVNRITKLDPVLAETRLVDLAEKLRDNPKYKKIADTYLDKPGVSTKDEIFGGKKGKRARVILENRFTKLMNLDQKLPSLRSNILKKIQKIIPELKGILSVDEIAGITSSMRRGSGPYAIFGQIVDRDFNTLKGRGIDKDKGVLEKQLVKLDKNDPKRVELQKKYNTAVTEFENKANVDNPVKKVKGLKVSYEPPSKTIKNKKIYNQYKDLFDTHYQKYGYSFEVPADRDSLVDISKKLDNKSFQGIVKNRFKNLIGRGGKIGALAGLGTLAGTGFALADESLSVDGKSILPEAAAGAAAAGTIGTKTGRNVLGKAFKTLGTRAAAVPLAGYTVYDNLKKGENVVDATLDPLVGLELMLPNMFKENVSKITSNPTIQKLLKVGKFGRAFTPIGAGITAAGLGIDAYKYGKERKQLLDSLTDEQKTELFRQEQSDVVKQQLRGDQDAFDEFSAARGGIASLNVKK